MRWIWFVPLLTSFSWLYLLSTFVPANLSLRSPLPYLLGGATACACISLRKQVRAVLPPGGILLAIPCALFVWRIPFPFSLGAYFLLAGVLLGVAAARVRALGFVPAAFLLVGVTLLLQAAATPLYYVLTSRWHELKGINYLAYPLLRLFGLDCAMSQGIVFLPSADNILEFAATLEKTGAYLLYHSVVGGCLLILLFERRRKKWLQFFGLILLFAYLRYVYMVVVFDQVVETNIFWRPYPWMLSFLPLGLVLFAALPLSESNLPREWVEWNRLGASDLTAFALLFAGFFCLIGVWGFRDPGEAKQGRILIDEKHSDWEWSTREMDTTWYGTRSTYNYFSMFDYFRYLYHPVRNKEHDLTADLLKDYDILVLKTPTSRYSDEEIDAIEAFVREGGGLWLIGDHTNIFGMNFYLNPVARRFGMFFNYDTTYDLATGRLTTFETPRVLPHPVVLNMPPFLFATSCTMYAPLTAENVIIGYGLRARLLNYSGRGFFEEDPLQNYEFGLFVQAAAVKHGKGRVAAFTDSTCFSNFYYFLPSKWELSVGFMEWLNRRNKYHWLNGFFLAAAVLFFALTLYRKRKALARTLAIGLAAGLAAAPAAVIVFGLLSQKAYPLPTPHTDYKSVCFEREYSNFTLPVKLDDDVKPDNYQTFYVWTQRMGHIPSLEKDLDAVLSKADLYVLLHPTNTFGPATIKKIADFVEKGGRVLVLDGPQNKASSANQLLESFGLRINYTPIQQPRLSDRENVFLGIGHVAGTVLGGIPYLRTPQNKVVFAVAGKGSGALGVMSDGFLFAQPQMGGTQVKPTERQKQIYRIQFYILDMLERWPSVYKPSRSAPNQRMGDI